MSGREDEELLLAKRREEWSAHSMLQFLTTTKMQTTLCYYGCFLALGLAISALGPALLALAENTQSTVSALGYVFTARSVGYLFGSMLGGPLFDRFNGNKLLALGIALTAIGCALIPVVTHVYLLAAIVTLVGLSMGFLDTGGNVSIIWLHGDNVGPYLQAMHFSFGVGAFFAPIIVGWFLEIHNGDPTWAFWSMSISMIFLPIWLLLLSRAPQKQKEEEDSGATLPREKFVVMATGAFLLVYVGAEVSAGGYLYSYAVLEELAGKTSAAFMTSVFWGALTLGRLISIPVSLYMSAAQILGVLMAGCITSNLFMIIFSRSSTALWIGTFLYGLSMSSAFPTALHMAEAYVSLTGQITSVMIVGASIGEMLIPLSVAHISFDWSTPITFLYILFFCSVAGLLIYGSIVIIGRPLAEAKKRNLHQSTIVITEDEDDEAFISSASKPAYGTFSVKETTEQ